VTHLDGRPRALDGQRLLIERLWRSLKHEDVYLKGYADGRELHNVAFQIGAPFTATAALTGGPADGVHFSRRYLAIGHKAQAGRLFVSVKTTTASMKQLHLPSPPFVCVVGVGPVYKEI
jgi:hypothetical protein